MLYWSLFTNDVATVACKELGLPTPGRALPAASFGEGAGPIWVAHVEGCTGQETRLQDCRLQWGVRWEFSYMFKDAAIQCDADRYPGADAWIARRIARRIARWIAGCGPGRVQADSGPSTC